MKAAGQCVKSPLKDILSGFCRLCVRAMSTCQSCTKLGTKSAKSAKVILVFQLGKALINKNKYFRSIQ